MPRALTIPGLPPAAVKIAEAAGKASDAEDELPVKEFALRAKLIRALLDNDGSLAAKAADAAPPAKPPAEAAAPDRGEPSWVCLGRLLSNLSFVHVWRRTYFLQRELGVPLDDFAKAAAPLVEAHPYRQYLATFSTDGGVQRIAWEKMTITEPDDLEFQEASMWLQYQSRHLPAAAGMQEMVAEQQDRTPRDFYTVVNNSQPLDYPWWSAGSAARKSLFAGWPGAGHRIPRRRLQVAFRGVGEGGGRLPGRGHGLRPPCRGRPALGGSGEVAQARGGGRRRRRHPATGQGV